MSEISVRSKFLIGFLIVSLVAVYLLWGLDYIEQRQEQGMLTRSIAHARQALAQLPQPPQNLDEKLAAAEARLSATQRSFPARLNSTQVINYLLESARRHHLTAIPLETQAWSTKNIRENDYNVFRLRVAIAGSYPQFLAFLSELEDGEYKTLLVEDLIVTRAPEHDEGENANGQTISITASLKLAIYTRPPTPD